MNSILSVTSVTSTATEIATAASAAMETGDNRSLTALFVIGGIAVALGIVSAVLKILSNKKKK